MNIFHFPRGIEPLRLPDALFAEAYECTSSQHRAWIKMTLALVETVHPAPGWISEKTSRRSFTGFYHTARYAPAPWLLLVFGSRYGSGIRLAAAVMAARLAGVENIAAFWIETPLEMIPPQLLTALELTGVEHTFSGSLPQLMHLLNGFNGNRDQGGGRLLLFTLEEKSSGPLREKACALDLAVWEDLRHPRLGITSGASPDTTVLQWAHPDAQIMPVDWRGHIPSLDALYCSPTENEYPTLAPLLLETGMEGTWLHLSLCPSFFHNRQITVRMTEDEREEEL